ncbi:hypothetical protein HYD77_00855 [Mycoplasmopsis bovis]|nr:hypothetical protein [Mycoplasmopsis bovis]QQH43516.1 hypothetical protein HYD77_00855 [Mycoplasmopsis bovis]
MAKQIKRPGGKRNRSRRTNLELKQKTNLILKFVSDEDETGWLMALIKKLKN